MEETKEKDFVEYATEIVRNNIISTATTVVNGIETADNLNNTSSKTIDKVYGDKTSVAIKDISTILAFGAVVGKAKGKKATDVKKGDNSNKGFYNCDEARKYFEDKHGTQKIAKVSIDKDTGRTIVETTQGSKKIKGDSKSGWNKLLNNSEANTDYKFNDSTYKTDEIGRVNEITFTPKDFKANRNTGQQKSSDRILN